MLLKNIWQKIKPAWYYINPYRKTLVELFDFGKDLYYVIVVEHKDPLYAVLLWIFALFAFLFTAFKILFMTKTQYE